MQVIQGQGFVRIDTASDEWFRRMLKEGGPTQTIRAKFAAALNGRYPHADARQFSERHYGAENLKRIVAHCDPLIRALEAWYEKQGHRGFIDWLNITGWGNDYKLIAAFEAWADNVTGDLAKREAGNG